MAVDVDRRRKKRPVERVLPILYAAVPLLVIAFVLPSALRPPPQTTQSGAEYSPNAPPNSKAQTLTKTEFQPGSATAGQEGGAPPPSTTTLLPQQAPPGTLAPQASQYGCAPGNPPLQWASVYAVPCQPAFVGDNGGATDEGVTATQVSVVVSFFGQQQTDGPINDATAQSSAQLRTLNDIQKYFNTHAMMYNRKLQLSYATEASATDQETSQRSDVDNAISKYHPIAAMVEGTAPEIDEYTKNKVLTDHWETLTEDLLQKEAPYAWGQNSPTEASQLAAEWICKQLKGYPPIHGITTGQPTFDPKAARKWGVIDANLPYFNSGPTLLAGMKTCGVSAIDQQIGVDNSADIENALLKFQSNDVSSIILNVDLVDDAVIMGQAEAINYFPEWITTGWGGLDQDAYLVRDYPADELKNAFGLTTTEINIAPENMECYKAVASVDSGFVAHALYCHIYWEMISHLVDAIELAGPHLTRAKLAQTYATLPAVTSSPATNWAIVGNYADPARRSWANSAAVYWWDPTDVDADGSVGTEAYGDCAERFVAGTFPTRPAHIFTSSGYYIGRTYGSRCTPPSG